VGTASATHACAPLCASRGGYITIFESERLNPFSSWDQPLMALTCSSFLLCSCLLFEFVTARTRCKANFREV
jgi:hypothetical protein